MLMFDVEVRSKGLLVFSLFSYRLLYFLFLLFLLEPCFNPSRPMWEFGKFSVVVCLDAKSIFNCFPCFKGIHLFCHYCSVDFMSFVQPVGLGVTYFELLLLMVLNWTVHWVNEGSGKLLSKWGIVWSTHF